MEYIDRIFYRKINPSDFKKSYDIDVPENGGGQTYLEAAGISNEAIVDFLEYAEISDSPLPDESRYVYTFNAHVLGNANESAFIEFAPRGGRNNYRISRQNLRHRHPAWSPENGFPEPNRDADGNYTAEGNFEGIIDNLIIIILRTTYKKYYAGYVNTTGLPDTWPQGIDLEKMFEDERRGVLNLSLFNVEFVDSLEDPFGRYETAARLIGGRNVLLYGVPGSGKSWTIEHEYCQPTSKVDRVVFHPDYTYSDFVGQILPEVAENGQVSYPFMPGPFTNILKEAYSDPTSEYILIIEEINRGNAPAIFGEIFQLLDRKKEILKINDDGFPIGSSEYGITNRDIARIVYGNPKHKVRIPSNLSIIATMNTSDQNVFTLDTAFQRRWDMRLIENTFENVLPDLANAEILDTTITWENFCTSINTFILESNIGMTSAEDKRLGAYFACLSDLKKNDSMIDLSGDEYSTLIQKEAAGTISKTEMVRLADIREAVKQYRKFPEKVIKYLWDDAFKFNREAVFDTMTYHSLEQVIRVFMYSQGIQRFDMFKEEVVGAFRNPNP